MKSGIYYITIWYTDNTPSPIHAHTAEGTLLGAVVSNSSNDRLLWAQTPTARHSDQSQQNSQRGERRGYTWPWTSQENMEDLPRHFWGDHWFMIDWFLFVCWVCPRLMLCSVFTFTFRFTLDNVNNRVYCDGWIPVYEYCSDENNYEN